MNWEIQLKEAFKFALSITLFYWLALFMDWDLAKYGALAIVLVSLGTSGASLQKGLMRIAGTTVGLSVGLLFLATFAQDRSLMFAAQAGYLLIVAYGMLGSRYKYAWFVAGFLPSLVWASTYGRVDDAFHYAVFRYLETTAGILIYTVVSIVLWPIHAGDQLDEQGQTLWSDVRQIFAACRRGLTGRPDSDEEESELRAKLAGTLVSLVTTLDAAYTDTPDVIAQRKRWELLRLNLRALTDVLSLWRQSIADCRHLDLQHLLPDLSNSLDVIDQRLGRIESLWAVRRDAPVDATGDDESLLAPCVPSLTAAGAELSPFDHAALANLLQQFRGLDVTSRECLRLLRVLSGLDPARAFRPGPTPPDLYRRPRWQLERLVMSLFPVICFAVAWVFWIYFDPPAGPSTVNMAAVAALMLVMTWMSPVPLLVAMVGSMVFLVAPVYFFVMPALATGVGLLILLFVMSFVFALLGYKSPVLKLAPMAAFVMMVGISNEQSYSFQGLVTGAFMITIGFGVVAVVQLVMTPMRPENVLVREIHRFFRGSARLTRNLGRSLTRPERRTQQRFASLLLSASRDMQAALAKVDRSVVGETGPEDARHLVTALQAVAIRLQALELAYQHLGRLQPNTTESAARFGLTLRSRIGETFERWSRLDPDRDAEPDEVIRTDDLTDDLRTTIDHLEDARETRSEREDVPIAMFNVLGCLRGLVESMTVVRDAMRRVEWEQWQQARF